MKFSFLILIFCLLTLFGGVPAQAQMPVDSLKTRLLNMDPGPEKFKIYGQISWDYISKDQFELAHKYTDSLKREAEQIEDSSGIALAQFYFGVIGRYKGEHSKALDHLDAYIRHYVSIGDSTRVAHGLFQKGSIYTQIGNYEKGLKNLYRALRIHEFENETSSINYALNGIAIVLKSAHRYNEALEVFERVLLADSLNTDIIMNIGNLYSEIKEFNKAELYYRKALKIDRAKGNDRDVAYDLENLGNLYNKKGAFEKALSFHSNALQIRDNLPYKIEEATSLSQIGYTHIQLGNYKLAKDFLSSALTISRATKTTKLTRDIYQKLAELYAKQNDNTKAYKFLKSYTVLKDSLLNEESMRQISELGAKYETEKKDQQIVILAKEKEIQEKEIQRQATLKNASILGAILLVLLGISFLYSFRLRSKNQRAIDSKDQEIKEINFKRQLTQLEMKALQAQINPHFIFNCMSSINDLILEGDTEGASIYLTKFSKLMRIILENAGETEVSLKNELDLLKAYVQLEVLRFNGSIDFNFLIDESIDPEDTYLPGMVLQPFVENAIWHGLLHKQPRKNGKITIEVEQQQEQLYCTVEDNGVGRQKAKELRQKSVWKQKSLGLKITEERLKLLGKELHQQLIRITDLKDKAGKALGTRVEVSIPLS